ncbi:Phospholipase/carboxylesterase/thioesterase [Halteromyces radiatus]|uniref:Phospholipase/carboxylesterase/thioesterase n=1 Tax=Halteromyces radiatus TaxID=101107 RepID=UPI00221FD5BE|nr:Phospholipase/carboxylesterase/thioesterase [Halteromyces radiatus]KAI8089381.1 Phospholipase/carboxylesterase/thioesterase [Halteromyces radiatus]
MTLDTISIMNPVVVLPTSKNHTSTIIWLHGLGDSGLGWYFLVEQLAPLFPTLKWILPNAPLRSVSFNDDATIPAWFNVASFDKTSHLAQVDEKGMLESVAYVNSLIESEANNGIRNIILGGFSQGCVMTLLTGLTIETPLSAIIGVSGWLPLGEKFIKMASKTNKQTPILMCHGDDDPVVKYKYGRSSARYLKKIGYNIEFKTYEGLGHTTSDQEIQDITAFIQQHLTTTTSSKL